MKIEVLGMILAAVATAGCVPQFIDVPSKQRKAMWIERDAVTAHAAIGNSEQSEILLSDVQKDQRLSSEERVIWVSGVDLKQSKLQRNVERIGAADAESNDSNFARQSSLVDVYSFSVVGADLAAKAHLNIQKFKGEETDRFYVEFLNDAPMTEEGINQMMQAWKYLAARLKERGLNTKNVILGGAKYDQPANAIVLVRVGK